MTVQMNLMRHSDIRTTLNLCGDAIPKKLAQGPRQGSQDGAENGEWTVVDCGDSQVIEIVGWEMGIEPAPK